MKNKNDNLGAHNQNRWQVKPLEPDEIYKWFRELEDHNMDTSAICAHDSYLIEIAFLPHWLSQPPLAPSRHLQFV